MEQSELIQTSPVSQDTRILQLDLLEALEEIMDNYGDEIKRLIFTYVRNTADTDDITQEVFVTVYQKLHTFQGNSSLRSWIYSIAINKSKDYLRSWQARNSRLKAKLIHSNRQDPFYEENLPENQMIQENEASELFHQVMELPIKYRELIILYYFKELSTTEISTTLDINEATVRTRLKRGREKLKQRLDERGESYGKKA